MTRASRSKPRTPSQAAADRHAADIARRMGRMLRDARRAARLTQQQAAATAGISRSTWSGLEVSGDPGATLLTWGRAAMAVGSSVDAYIRGASGATEPRDAAHLRNQELIVRLALGGGWRALPEQPIDHDARTSRAADVLLRRASATGQEYAIVEVWDWFDDVGASLRDMDRRLAALERYAIAQMSDDVLPRTGGCWALRATQRNRRLVEAHRNLFRARFPGSPHAWLAALTAPSPLPAQPALLWISVSGERLFPSRITATA